MGVECDAVVTSLLSDLRQEPSHKVSRIKMYVLNSRRGSCTENVSGSEQSAGEDKEERRCCEPEAFSLRLYERMFAVNWHRGDGGLSAACRYAVGKVDLQNMAARS